MYLEPKIIGTFLIGNKTSSFPKHIQMDKNDKYSTQNWPKKGPTTSRSMSHMSEIVEAPFALPSVVRDLLSVAFLFVLVQCPSRQRAGSDDRKRTA